MKKEDLIKNIYIKRYVDKELAGTVVSFEAKCPLGNCTHSDLSTAHYGDEKGAENVLISKIVSHVQRDHGIELA